MVAALQLRKDDQRQRRHARAGNRRPFGAVQAAALLGQHVGVGMSIAGIDVARLTAGQQCIGLFGIGTLVDARKINRRRVGRGCLLGQSRRTRTKIVWVFHGVAKANVTAGIAMQL